MEAEKQRAAGASLAFNLISMAAKIVAAVLSGSVSMLSEAINSAVDVASSSIAFVGVRAAAVPPDEEHPYGHGKIESLAGFGESILLFLTVIYIVAESIHRLIVGQEIAQVEVALWVMAASTLGSFLVSRYVFSVARRSGSLALLSNGQHLAADFWTSAGVLVALGLTKFAGWKQADAVIALVLAIWIGITAIKLSKTAFHELIDRRLTEEDLDQIEAVLASDKRLLSYHRMRTRRSGHMRYVDLHIVVPRDWSVVEAHRVADDLEKTMEHALAPAKVVIHVDPYDEEKAGGKR
ncbi:MAG: cation diffusion facilitator family transporter [Fimbriimonadaceae bacterium]